MTEVTQMRRSTEASEWSRLFARRLLVTDAVVTTWAVIGAYVFRFGFGPTPAFSYRGDAGALDFSYVTLSVGLVTCWVLLLTWHGSRDHRVVGLGPEEYKRVAKASFRLFGAVAITSYAFQLQVARGFVAIAFPVGTIALLASRWMWRNWLTLVRRDGRWSSRVLLVGGEAYVGMLREELQRNRQVGYWVVGACVSAPTGNEYVGDVPVVGTLSDVPRAVREHEADAVVVTIGPEMGPRVLRHLAWSLEDSGVELIVSPSLTDVAGPRIHTRPVPGLPLLHVEGPRYEGATRVVKEVMERVACALAVLLLSPVLVLIAVLVKRSSPGPVFYRQERVGKDGARFLMTKFRTMVDGADAMLPTLVDGNEASGVLFKLHDDPRVTGVGRVLRRYSLDELPQLFDVVGGSMSLVGPRPPLPTEVARYGDDVRRRLLVKPGITGLWQVSGRSDLSWEDSVRLDLYYVENWSIMQDLMILVRTVRAVVRAGGAY
jgi:exopolysaccharide biosynthesis polyprenyl glycosylphosphotransferase